MTRITVRMYGPLNDFLAPQRRYVSWSRQIAGHPAVKDLIESLGVPHPEADLILANGTSVPFDYAVQDGDRIAVFPHFVTLDIGTVTRVRPPALGVIRFVVDVHLGTLARRLRLVGLDTAYRVDADDAELAEVASRENRILLTRDVGLLKRRVVTHGCFIRNTHPHRQLVEVLRRFGPLALEPFSRCLRCNAELHEVAKEAITPALLPRTREHYERFHACGSCGRIYWKGSHWTRLVRAIDAARHEAEGHTVSCTTSRITR